VSTTVQRPEVAVVRHPIADGRNNVVGYELRFGGAVDLGDPSRDAKATSALLVEAFGDIVIEAPRTQGALLDATDVEDHDAFIRV
jgi:c-di-GMP-related signal transduction protein